MKKFVEVRRSWVLLVGILLSSFVAEGQKLQNLDFFEVGTSRGQTPQVKAESWVLCDGENISIHVEVKDPTLNLPADNKACDQVRIWLALEDDAYPRRFGYQLHSDYYAYVQTSEKASEALRLFSADLDTDPSSRIDDIFRQSDYPKIERDSSRVPPLPALTEATVPFGMVGYAFFPDTRKVEWVNQGSMKLLEEALGLQLANLADSVKYFADIHRERGGYSMDISFSPHSIGFVKLPEMDRIRIMIEIWDGGKEGAKNQPSLSTAEGRIAGRPSTFNLISFDKPLQTNFLNIPKELYYKANYFPTLIFAESSWTPASVDVDALVYLPKQTSENLTEVKFYKQNLDYDQAIYQGYSVETLRVQLDFVNQVPREKAYTLVNNQLITTEKAPYLISDPKKIRTGFFVFPDGNLGMIAKSSFPIDPFGWENCETCVEERISIIRISPQGQETLLEIRQGEGTNAYCTIKDLSYPQFYLSTIDWIEEGKVMMLVLDHQYLKEKHRVKVSWDSDGRNVKVRARD